AFLEVRPTPGGLAAQRLPPTQVWPGTAFCVQASGIFLTCEQVVRFAGPAPQVTLVLDPGLPSQRVLRAKLLRADKDLDLALLRAEGAGELPALPLGSVDQLTELADVVVFGFPPWSRPAPARTEYPAA